MRILHTADWHIGQELRGFSRQYEHDTFLEWLVRQCREHLPDALVIAGDVFDQANPSTDALRTFFRFVDSALVACPAMRVIAVAGNHDSGARFDALAPGVRTNLHMVGSARRAGWAAGEAMPVVRAGDGHVLAAPYFRLSDLPLAPGTEAMAERVRALYGQLWEDAEPVLRGTPGVVTGHLTVLGGQESPDSERPIFIGGQQAAPLDVFPAEAAYIALGHLHRAQSFAGGRVRYSGSPFPMSATERRYGHRTVRIDAGRASLETLDLVIPRPVPWLRLPDVGTLAPESVVATLNSRLEDEGIDPDQPCDRHPFVEIALTLDVPRPHIAAQLVGDIRRAGLPARIIGVSAETQASDSTVPGSVHATQDGRHTPQQLFEAAFARIHDGAAPSEAHQDVLRLVMDNLPT